MVTASWIKRELKLSSLSSPETSYDYDGKDDYSMVHAVAGLIRNDMLATNKDPNTYPSTNVICDGKTAKHVKVYQLVIRQRSI